MKSRITQIVLTVLILQLASGLTFGQEGPHPEASPKTPATITRPGTYSRSLIVSQQKRKYLVHVPKNYDPKTPTPIVLALHGAAMDGSMIHCLRGGIAS